MALNPILKNVLKLLEKLATSTQAVLFMQYLISLWWKVPVSVVKKVWEKVEALVEKAAEKYPGKRKGEEKYTWVLESVLEWAKEEGLDLKVMVYDRIMDEVLGWFARKGVKT